MRTTIWLAFAGLLGCSSSDGSATTTTTVTGTYPCDVQAILTARCTVCHADTPQYPVTVPFPLTQYSDTRRTTSLLGTPNQPVWQAIDQVLREKRMPLETKDPYSTPDPLPGDESATLLAWTDAGAPPNTTGTTCP